MDCSRCFEYDDLFAEGLRILVVKLGPAWESMGEMFSSLRKSSETQRNEAENPHGLFQSAREYFKSV